MNGDQLTNGIIGVLIAVVGLALTSVIFSQRANTANVITAGGNAFGTIIKAAVSPVA